MDIIALPSKWSALAAPLFLCQINEPNSPRFEVYCKSEKVLVPSLPSGGETFQIAKRLTHCSECRPSFASKQLQSCRALELRFEVRLLGCAILHFSSFQLLFGKAFSSHIAEICPIEQGSNKPLLWDWGGQANAMSEKFSFPRYVPTKTSTKNITPCFLCNICARQILETMKPGNVYS